MMWTSERNELAIIRTENLTYIYGEGTPFRKVAVDDVNLQIDEGEMVGVIGHTGSGKSTLIQHFNGLLKATSGNVYIDGEKLWDDKAKLRPVRFKVGLVFQYPEYQLFEETCYKDIAFGPKNMGLDNAEIDRRIKETAKMVGITPDILDKSPFELSGGQKRRVAIAGVMAMEPKVLILDEPASGLDPKGREQILGLIREYHQEKKNTVVLVSHSMEDIAKHTSKILVMNKAKLFCYDDTVKVFHRAAELEEMGLAVPQITRVFNRLKAMGCDINDDVYTTKYAKELLLKLLAR
jgi:energy-coupling factor transport system ATP-binding protein